MSNHGWMLDWLWIFVMPAMSIKTPRCFVFGENATQTALNILPDGEVEACHLEPFARGPSSSCEAPSTGSTFPPPTFFDFTVPSTIFPSMLVSPLRAAKYDFAFSLFCGFFTSTITTKKSLYLYKLVCKGCNCVVIFYQLKIGVLWLLAARVFSCVPRLEFGPALRDFPRCHIEVSCLPEFVMHWVPRMHMGTSLGLNIIFNSAYNDLQNAILCVCEFHIIRHLLC